MFLQLLRCYRWFLKSFNNIKRGIHFLVISLLPHWWWPTQCFLIHRMICKFFCNLSWSKMFCNHFATHGFSSLMKPRIFDLYLGLIRITSFMTSVWSLLSTVTCPIIKKKCSHTYATRLLYIYFFSLLKKKGNDLSLFFSSWKPKKILKGCGKIPIFTVSNWNKYVSKLLVHWTGNEIRIKFLLTLIGCLNKI